jgi:SAM-dependent methyltransferase
MCNNNLRAMALAAAITDSFHFNGTLAEFSAGGNSLQVLEINPAGNLTRFLKKMAGHRLVEYPEFDMQNLNIPNNSYDLVIHSDTLEHVPDPVRGLSECRRILKQDGVCIFTIPIIVDRLSRNRDDLPPSHHGDFNVRASDQIVHTEFGADFWKTVFEAGFKQCNLFVFEYPAAIAIIAKP